MRTFLEQLRKKPKALRQKIAWITTCAFSLLVFVVWFNVWSADSGNEKRTEARIAGEELSPLDGLANTFQSGMEGISASFKEFQDTSGQVDQGGKDSSGKDIVYPEEVFEGRGAATSSAPSSL